MKKGISDFLNPECFLKTSFFFSKTDRIPEDIPDKVEIFENIEFLTENVELVKQEKLDCFSIEPEIFSDVLSSSVDDNESCHRTVKTLKKLPTSKQCEYCDKTFSRSTHLRRHLLTHTKEKHFKCKICCKAFSRSDHLAIHESTFHSQERPYACELCEKVGSKVIFYFIIT